MQYLCEVDADIAQNFAIYGSPAPRSRPSGFEAFVAAIVSQQISKEAAATIFKRVKNTLSELSAQAVLDSSVDALRGAGLSGRKTEYLIGLAHSVRTGEFDVSAIEFMDNASAIEYITQLRGFGRWSAEVYLMFSLGRQDVFPADDLALQVALARLKSMSNSHCVDKPRKVTPKQARQLIEHWSPWRSVGALFLWHYYRGSPQL